MKEIKLSKGYVTLVDDEDYDFLSQWKWCAKEDCRTVYAIRTEYEKIPGGGVRKKGTIYLHRVLLPVEGQIDHIDINGLNNQKHNLREATQGQNQRNKRSALNTTSKYKGVHKTSSSKYKCWIAMIGVPGSRQKRIGAFYSEVEAAIAYNNEAKILYGEFANLNEV